MVFDPRAIEAKLSLGLIPPEKLPAIAIDAIEAGHGSPAVLHMASLTKATGWETDPILPAFLTETGMNLLSIPQASTRVAYDLARELLDGRRDPLQEAWRFERLAVKADYPSELGDLGQLYDDIYLALTYGKKSEEEVRNGVTDLLIHFTREYERTNAIP